MTGTPPHGVVHHRTTRRSAIAAPIGRAPDQLRDVHAVLPQVILDREGHRALEACGREDVARRGRRPRATRMIVRRLCVTPAVGSLMQ